MRKWIFIGALALTTIFCSVNLSDPPTPTADVSAIVNATLTAVAAGQVDAATATQTVAPPTATFTQAAVIPASTETSTPEFGRDFFPELGTITGALSYPSSAIPPLRIAAFDVTTGGASYTDTAAGQSAYTFDLLAGTYHIVAYTLDGTLAGGYSQMVPCGLSAECADHSLINVTVTANTTISGVDPGDWYAPEGAFPPMPTSP